MELEPIVRLTRDVKAAALTLSKGEARFLVDYFYILQAERIRSAHQVRALTKTGEPSEVLGWVGANVGVLERNIKTSLGAYAEASPVGRWSLSVRGIGPIIAAGLLAHLDITQAPTVGHIWRFAGLDPTRTWKKATKRPWNAALKTLCWKIGESFVKVSGHDDDVYGHLYLDRKAREVANNEAGVYVEQARQKLATCDIDKDTDAYGHYAAGRLPPGHLHARAKRWAVKLFLAHWHHVAFEVQYGVPPPKPYVISQLGHAHEIRVPNWSASDQRV